MLKDKKMPTYRCRDGCCCLQIEEYDRSLPNEGFIRARKGQRRKAGVFVFDPNTQKILLVQSRGNLWGPPKGTALKRERAKNCAIRELREETGISLSYKMLSRYVIICNRATYFFVEMDEIPVSVQTEIQGNDANGVGWVSLTCLQQLILHREIRLNQHCKLLLRKFLGVTVTLPPASILTEQE